MLLTALIGDGYLRREGVEGPEFHVLAMMSASGAMMMGAANDLIVVFLGLEILSIALYVLAAFNHKRAESGEAALKYFVLGAFSSAVFVYGIALTYGATGSTNLPQIADYLSKNVVATNGVLLGGLALLLVGFGFKIAAVPFHMWSPDVYQGSPSPITGFMAAVAKAGAFAALLRVFVSSFGTVRTDWQPIIWGLAILSLVVGAVVALMQTRRQADDGVLVHQPRRLHPARAWRRPPPGGCRPSLYYLFAYMFLVIGSFAVITVMAREGDTGHQISDYRGLARRQPVLALAFAVLLLGQAGVPSPPASWPSSGWSGPRWPPTPTRWPWSPWCRRPSPPSSTCGWRSPCTRRWARWPTRSTARLGPTGGAPDRRRDGRPPTRGRVRGRPRPDPTPEAVTSLSVLTDAPPADAVTERGAVPVPLLTWVALGLCVAFTVVFGIIPEPILDFAHQATLLFT